MADLEWYYVDTETNPQGPVTQADVKRAWDSGKMNAQSLVWNENMENWVPASSAPDLMAFLKPKPAPTPVSPRTAAQQPQQNTAALSPRSAAAQQPQQQQPQPQQQPQQQPPQQQQPQQQRQQAALLSPRSAQLQRDAAVTMSKPTKQESFWKEYSTPEGIRYYHNSLTGATTWDKPDELKSPDELDKKGDWFWIPERDQGFIPARRAQVFHDGRVQMETEDGKTMLMTAKDAASLDSLQWSHLRRLEKDLVMLDVMNRPLIIYNLRKRFLQNEIYTNVGTILVSVNPYKQLPLYTPNVIDLYRHKGNRQLDPHVFSIADNAYNNLIEQSRNQAIVISGESGAGKTESTKQCLQYLAEIAGSESNVEQRILLANPILEAFGNAKTVRNNNSSRFGKYVEIFFDARGTICGATNTNYLLEKSRVILQNEGERNFHIFYQLCMGASTQQKQQYKLKKPEDFHYLSQATTRIDGIDDGQDFKEVEAAMNQLGFKKEEVESVFRIVAGLLHLGNIKFVETGDRKCQVETKDSLHDAAELLQVTDHELNNSITSKVMRLKGQEPITITLSVQEANETRDALAKFVYEKLFDWLVIRINISIGLGKASTKSRSIGILDIFGFEIFKTNSFEQLCINFANEKLQQYFNQHTFKMEETIYRQEEIKFVHVEYIDNQPVLDLIEQRPSGVLPMIDEELKIPKGTDQTYIVKLKETHKATAKFEAVLSDPNHFIIKHYAGDVHYESAGFLEKNKDRLNEDTFALLQLSKFAFLKALFPESDMDTTGRKQTLGFKFSGQLNNLMDTLGRTEPHYVRCIKPNHNKAALQFIGTLVLEQLQYSGVFEAIQIRKSGYPFRLSHEQFVKRFKCIVPKKTFRNYRDGCQELIRLLNQSTEQVQVGKTMVLYRAEQHKNMELIRNLAVERTVIFIQKWIRRFLAQNLLKNMKKVRPALIKALESAQKTKSVEEIEKALALASTVSKFFIMKEVDKLQRLKRFIMEEQRLNKQLEELVRKDPEKNFEALVRAVASADEIELHSPISEEARQIVATIKEKRAIAAALAAGVQEYDEEKLRLNLEKAQQLGVQENVDKAWEMLDALIQEKQYLSQMAEYEIQMLEEEPMHDLISRADGIHYSSPEIERVRELLFNTPEEKFVQMQLKAAVTYNDSSRVIRVTIRLKDIFFSRAGDMFQFSNYGRLWDRMEWANMKIFGFNKEELAAGMLSWTNAPIHNSLTRLDSRLNKLAKNIFKSILGYMGERPFNYPTQLAKEILQICLENEGIRDEVYCQIIKQLTQNPSQDSIERGWQMMAICLETTPPNKDFENFLEMYLRTYAPNRDRYLTILHQSLYSGPLPMVPTEQEILKIVNGSNLRQFNMDIRAEEKAEAKPALAFGGMGPSGASSGMSPRGAPPAGPPPSGPPPSGMSPRGAPPAGPPPAGPPPSKGAPPAGPPPAGPPPSGPSPSGMSPRGLPPAGPPPAGPPPAGPPPAGPPPAGPPPAGPPPSGMSPRGLPPAGPPPAGPPPSGMSPRGLPPAGPPPAGPPPAGPSPAGPPPAGPPPSGLSPRGLPSAGPPPAGPAPAGPPPAGPPPAGPPPAGPSPAPPSGFRLPAPVARGPAPAGPAPAGPPPSGPSPAPPSGFRLPAPVARGPAPAGPAPAEPSPAGPSPAPPSGFRLPAPVARGPAPAGPAPAGPPPRGAPPAGPPPKKSPWVPVKDPASGGTYYHNTQTNQVQWEKPADL